MYLPPGFTFLPLLQQRVSLPDILNRPTLHTASLGELSGHQVHHDFGDKVDNLGKFSPYHDTPTVAVNLPDDCTVDQVILLHRHGSRGPKGQLEFIRDLVSTLKDARDIIQSANLPSELEFLRDGYECNLVREQLTPVGCEELSNHGSDFASHYDTNIIWTDTIISTDVQRVKDSADCFAQGFFGREAENVRFLTTSDFKHEVSWLDTWHDCPNIPYNEAKNEQKRWVKKYILPIKDRLNERIRNATSDLKDIFGNDDTRGAIYACPFDLAAYHKSPWCDVFTPEELQGLEYEVDLRSDIISGGHKVEKYPAGRLAGAIYVKKLIERLTNTADDTKPLHLEFAHDLTILLVLSTMGLNKDDNPLTSAGPPTTRKFRTSDQTPFGAQMVWERFTCQNSFLQEPQVRLLLNGKVFPLTNCEIYDETYGTCSLNEFEKANKWSMDVVYQDTYWNDTCGVPLTAT